MGKSAAVVMAITLVFANFAGNADAAGHGGGGHGGGGFHGGVGGFHGATGGFRNGSRSVIRGGASVRFGFRFYSCSPYLDWPYDYALPCGYYPYPGDFYSYPIDGGPYPRGAVAQPTSPYWYYCDDPKGYYPYVTSCADQWEPVPATPPPPAPPAG